MKSVIFTLVCFVLILFLVFGCFAYEKRSVRRMKMLIEDMGESAELEKIKALSNEWDSMKKALNYSVNSQKLDRIDVLISDMSVFAEDGRTVECKRAKEELSVCIDELDGTKLF